MKTIAKLNMSDRNDMPDTITEAFNAIVAILTQPVQYAGNPDTTTVAILREDCAFAVKQARFALQERDSLKALNADLLQALEFAYSVLKKSVAFETALPFWCYGGDGYAAMVESRSAIAQAKGQGKV